MGIHVLYWLDRNCCLNISSHLLFIVNKSYFFILYLCNVVAIIIFTVQCILKATLKCTLDSLDLVGGRVWLHYTQGLEKQAGSNSLIRQLWLAAHA